MSHKGWGLVDNTPDVAKGALWSIQNRRRALFLDEKNRQSATFQILYKKLKINILNPSLFGVEGGSFFKRWMGQFLSGVSR